MLRIVELRFSPIFSIAVAKLVVVSPAWARFGLLKSPHTLRAPQAESSQAAPRARLNVWK